MVLTDEEKEKKESFGCFEIQESERMNVVVKQIYFCFIVISLVTGCEITELL
jgi:hypothetical protein